MKPVGKVQWSFKAYYLYGVIASQTGESLWLDFSHLDGICFQMFLDQLAEKYPAYLNVIQLDNGKFHHSSSLRIPDNILLIFQPPYSSELNHMERIWSHIKQELSWKISENLDDIKEKFGAFLEELSAE